MSKDKVTWNIQVERGDYNDDNHFESQIRFNEGDSSMLEVRISRLLEYLVEEGVMDHLDYSDEDGTCYDDELFEEEDDYDDVVEEDYDNDEDE